jgi:hypothetical protein
MARQHRLQPQTALKPDTRQFQQAAAAAVRRPPKYRGWEDRREPPPPPAAAPVTGGKRARGMGPPFFGANHFHPIGPETQAQGCPSGLCLAAARPDWPASGAESSLVLSSGSIVDGRHRSLVGPPPRAAAGLPPIRVPRSREPHGKVCSRTHPSTCFGSARSSPKPVAGQQPGQREKSSLAFLGQPEIALPPNPSSPGRPGGGDRVRTLSCDPLFVLTAPTPQHWR